jgi:hypothetical protein
LSILVNKGSDAARPNKVLDFVNTAADAGDDLATVFQPAGSAITLDMDGNQGAVVQVSGRLTLMLSDFVQVQGDFAFTKVGAVSAVLSGSSTARQMVVTTLGLSNVTVFAGAGPYFIDNRGPNPADPGNPAAAINGSDGVIDEYDTPDPDAAGLLLKDVSLAIALFKSASRGDSSSFYAVKGSAQTAELPGIVDSAGSSVFSLSASGFRIEVSGGKDALNPKAKAAINFSALAGGSLAVRTGPSSSVEIDYVAPMLRVAIERATLAIDRYVYVSGALSFSKESGLRVILSDQAQTVRTVDAYTFGAGSVDVFVGSGPYFVDSNQDNKIDESDERDSDALGLALENVNFGLTLMRPTDAANKSTRYVAMKASASYAGLVGIDTFELSADGVSVGYNSVTNSKDPSDNRVIDFKASFPDTDGAGPDTAGYALDTGNGKLKFEFSDKVLQASVAQASLRIDDYVFVRGALDFSKGPEQTLTLSDGTTKVVSVIDVAATDVSLFFGANGPYWEDLDGNQSLSWALPDGTTLTRPDGTPMTASTVDGVTYGDLNDDGTVDAGETAEINGPRR